MTSAARPVAVITGASSGVGLETARLLADAGWDLALAARTADRLEAAAAPLREAGRRVVAIPSDVADPEQARALIRRAVEELGRIDALVNNAGRAELRQIDKSDAGFLREMYDANALGPANSISAAWPHFAAQKSGCVVNVSTKGTSDPFPGFFAYAAAKAAVNVMAMSCANEGRRIGVRAFAVAPGAIETRMLRSMFSEKVLPPSACLSPGDVAQVIVDCIEGRRDEDNGKVIPLLRS